MKNNYYQPRRRSGISSLLNILGILFAIVIVIGAMDRAGVRVILDNDKESQYHSAGFLSGNQQQAPQNEQDIIVVGTENQSADYPAYNRTPSSYSASRSIKIDETAWIERFASTARKQALVKGVPAGVALAVGLEKIKSGININDWETFVEEVTIPLVAIKQMASREELQTYYKYSANSYRWIDGLGEARHFTSRALKTHLQKYHLDRYDNDVKEMIAGGGTHDQQFNKKSTHVADEVASSMVARRIKKQETEVLRTAEPENAASWEQRYDEIVGKAVAKEIARKKLKSGQYISEEDMAGLIDETNEETGKVLERNVSLLGRKINREHKDADNMLDITNPNNVQAREELYQKEIKKHRVAGDN
ncbi:MAG: hypothetical protein MI974_03540 [Chitinophagales bacterium]|nr:hypothetical protein [Chitinophagales bacterium]